MNLRVLTERLSRKHLIWLATAGGGILIAIILMSGPEKPAGPLQQKKPVEVNLLGNADVEKEHWRATAEKELETLKSQQKEISEQLKSLAEQMKEREEREKKGRAQLGQAVPKDFPPLPPLPPLNVGQPPAQPQPSAPPSPGPEPIRIFGPEASTFSPAALTTGSGAGPAASGAKGKPGESGKAEEQPYLPSGSFVSGILLSGLDAPAGVNASKEPHPVLIKLSDLAMLPNHFKFDIKDCFIVGEGYGDLSSERAYIRTTTLSCVRGDGSSVDVPLKGFVAGEDGKVGLRGRVVSKQGQFLAKALVAGFAEGMANVFRLSATAVSVSPLGATQSIDPSRALEAGAYGGASRALERLAQHYIDMAERLFPVIEIDAGRKAEVVVLQGRPLEPMEEKGR
jgi:conjugal transfer pilus assembly protein TraB